MLSFKSHSILLFAVILLASTMSTNAEVPQVINYQGRLTDTNGDPVADGSYDITFSIYSGAAGGTAYWTSGVQSVTVTGGLFEYQLGSSVAFPVLTFPTNGSRYLGIKVGADPELVPRTQLVSVPYAFRVSSIDGAQGGAIVGGLELTADIYTDENHAFEIGYPSDILFNSGNELSANFEIGTTFGFDSDIGELRLGTVDRGYKLPSSDGSAGEVLSTNGSGQVSWGNAIPTGVIVMWSGAIANIPHGWALCDGTDGTPDLQDRFILGAGNTYGVGETGGTATHTLTTDEMPSHDHGGTASGSTSNNGDHTHNLRGEYFGSYDTYGVCTVENSSGGAYHATMSAGAHSHTVTSTVSPDGGGQPHENRPPYYSLAYIMKL